MANNVMEVSRLIFNTSKNPYQREREKERTWRHVLWKICWDKDTKNEKRDRTVMP